MWTRRLAKFAVKAAPTIDKDDLHQQGCIGLIQAAEHFDSTRGIVFRTFADHRIKGAMLDTLRSFFRRTTLQPVFSLDTGLEGEELSGWDLAGDDGKQAQDIENGVVLRDAWRNRSQTLSVRHREVLEMRYRDEMSMREIGEHYGVSDSRISQVHKAAIARLAA